MCEIAGASVSEDFTFQMLEAHLKEGAPQLVIMYLAMKGTPKNT